MSLENFENLKELTLSLKDEELNLAKKHLTAFESYRTRTPSQMLRLFKTILKRPSVDFEKAKQLVASGNSIKSFNQLVKRTLDRVLESLILDINIKRNEVYSPVFQNRFKIRKLIMQASILQGRGLSTFSLKNFNWIIKTAKKYELYDELIETLYLKQAVVFNKDGKKAYEKIAREIKYFEACRNCLREAKDLYRSYYAQASFQANIEKLANNLNRDIQTLDEQNNKLNSANVNLYLYPLKMECATLKKDFDSGLAIGNDFIDLLKSNPSIYSKIRIGIYYTNLADNEISAFRFKSAINYSKKALEYLEGRMTVNNVIAYDLTAISLFYEGRYNECVELIEEILSEPIVERYKLHKTKLFYYKAMSYFALEDYRGAFLLLNNLSEIEKDKEGWNVWIRIMRIVCSIELLKLNLIDYDLENFRKYIQRIDKKYEVNERSKQILRVLLELDKIDFNFSELRKSKVLKKDFQLINSLEGKESWKPNTPELILFDLWIHSKVNMDSYVSCYNKFINKKSNDFMTDNLREVDSVKKFNQLSIEF